MQHTLMWTHNNIKFPKALQAGDTIYIVSPAGKIQPDYIFNAKPILERWGLHVQIGEFALSEDGRFAGNRKQRQKDLQKAIDNPNVKAIFCARGGYGCIQYVDQLDITPLQQHPKWLIGYSDVTILHALWQTANVASIHAPMLKHLTEEENRSITYLKEILFGTYPTYTLPSHILNQNGHAQGRLVGGNLSTLYSLRGTPYDFIPEGAILFIEDIGERAYHINRMIENLRLGGVLQRISGLIVGQFTDCPEDILLNSTIIEGISQLTQELKIPVCFDFPTGHVSNNYPLICGAEVILSVNKDQTIFQQIH